MLNRGHLKQRTGSWAMLDQARQAAAPGRSVTRSDLADDTTPQAAEPAGRLARPVSAVPDVGGLAAAGHPPVPRSGLAVRIAGGRHTDPDRRAQAGEHGDSAETNRGPGQPWAYPLRYRKW